MSGISVKFSIKDTKKLLEERGIEPCGRVQKIIDSETMRLMQPYMPFDTGTMASSVKLATVIGSGEVKVNTPYAHRRLKEARSNGLRGPNYFERMKADRLDDILNTAASASGGNAKK